MPCKLQATEKPFAAQVMTQPDNDVVAINTPGQNSKAVAEMAFRLLAMRMRRGADGATGHELYGRKLGLVGFGQCVAHAANSFGVEMHLKLHENRGWGAESVSSQEEIFKQCGAESVSSQDEIFKRCDFVSLHIPATAQTKNSIGQSLISSLPKGGCLINIAGSEVLDEVGLTEALLARPDLAYITDVPLGDARKMQQRLGNNFAKQVFSTRALLRLCSFTAETNDDVGSAAARQIFDFGKADVSPVNRKLADFKATKVPAKHILASKL